MLTAVSAKASAGRFDGVELTLCSEADMMESIGSGGDTIPISDSWERGVSGLRGGGGDSMREPMIVFKLLTASQASRLRGNV